MPRKVLWETTLGVKLWLGAVTWPHDVTGRFDYVIRIVKQSDTSFISMDILHFWAKHAHATSHGAPKLDTWNFAGFFGKVPFFVSVVWFPTPRGARWLNQRSPGVPCVGLMHGRVRVLQLLLEERGRLRGVRPMLRRGLLPVRGANSNVKMLQTRTYHRPCDFSASRAASWRA